MMTTAVEFGRLPAKCIVCNREARQADRLTICPDCSLIRDWLKLSGLDGPSDNPLLSLAEREAQRLLQAGHAFHPFISYHFSSVVSDWRGERFTKARHAARARFIKRATRVNAESQYQTWAGEA